MIHYIYDITENKDSISKLIEEIKSKPEYIFFDTETTGLNPYLAKTLLYQFMVNEDVYVVNRARLGKDFLIRLIDLCNKSEATYVGHNIKFDVEMVKVDLDLYLNKVFDTMIAEVIINTGVGKELYSLAELVRKYCFVDLDKSMQKSFIVEGQSLEDFSQEQIDYAGKDIVFLRKIIESQLEEINSKGLAKVVDLEMKVVKVVSDMELHGVSLDVPHWRQLTNDAKELSKKYSEEFKAIVFDRINNSKPKLKFSNALEFAEKLCIPIKTKRARTELENILDTSAVVEWAKGEFNINSHKQMLNAFNIIGIKTDSTNEKILNKLPKDEVIDKLLDIRGVEKNISTYGENVIDLINPVTGKIHTDYFQMGTSTGRFSSRNPNMQNLPRKGGYREGFVARDGYSFISMDYSQQEYRLVGALSKEPKIIDAYVSGSDMHTATAANRFNKSLKEVTPEERNFGKTMNFAILYGTTEFGLMRNFSVSKAEALSMLDDFYAGYPVLTAFKNAVEDIILKRRYSVTPMGRKRFFESAPVYGSPKELEKLEARIRREGFNMIIQGGGADITKIALYDMFNLNPFGDLFYPVLQVHDEIVCEVSDTVLKDGEDFMRNCMVGAFQPFLGEIPAVVDSRVSKRWGKG
jgi:DNA polymerase I-like protein with 3'-5' exonuclease and polymerase domains